jgi:hypothetical protein
MLIAKAWNEELSGLFSKTHSKFQMLTSKARYDDKMLISKASNKDLWENVFTESLKI